MSDADIAAQPLDQTILDGSPRAFIGAEAVKAVIGVNDRHLTDRKLLPAVHVRVVHCDQVREIILHADIVVFMVALDAVQKVGKLTLALDGAVAVKVGVVGKDAPGIEPVLILTERQFRIHLLDGADQRMCGRDGETERSGLIYFQVALDSGQGIFRQSGVIKQLAVQIDSVHL